MEMTGTVSGMLEILGGYAQFMQGTVIVDQMKSATDREKEAIKQLLESGIIFNEPE